MGPIAAVIRRALSGQSRSDAWVRSLLLRSSIAAAEIGIGRAFPWFRGRLWYYADPIRAHVHTHRLRVRSNAARNCSTGCAPDSPMLLLMT